MDFRYMAAVLLLFLAVTENALSQTTTNTTGINYLSFFGEMYQYTKAETKIYHMEPDLFQPGNILFSDGHSLKTTNGFTTTTIVGKATESGHAEGYGEDARFHALAGFHQINSTKVIAVSWGTHCLVTIDRITRHSSEFAGSCTNPGDEVGDKTESRFRTPSTMIPNINNRSELLFADNRNQAIKVIDITNGKVDLLARSADIGVPKGMAFDKRDTQILYVTSASSIVIKFNMSENSVELIAGQNMNSGLADGYYTNAQFYHPREIIQVANDVFAIADQSSNRVKVLDVKTKMVSSICNGAQGNVNGLPQICELENPRALLLLNDTLFVGDTGAIRALPVNVTDLECLHGCEKKKSDLKQLLDKTSCDKNITTAIKPDEIRAKVWISKDKFLLLEEGVHSFYDVQSRCYTNVVVEDHYLPCPTTVAKTAAPGTRTTNVELVLDGVTQSFTLPVGKYPYYIEKGANTCDFSVIVTDPNVKRRLTLQAKYDSVNCNSLNDNGTMSLVNQAARKHFIQIDEICKDVCKADQSEMPTVECSGSIMSITWPTDITFDSDVTTIDTYLLSILSKRIQVKGSILSVIILSPTPRVVYPTPAVDGSSAEVLLTSFCSNGFVYNKVTDSCPY